MPPASFLMHYAHAIPRAMTALAVLCAACAAHADSEAPLSGSHTAMGTEFSFTVYPEGDAPDRAALGPLLESVYAAIDDLEARISSWRADSQTSYVNHRAADGPVRVAPDFIALLEASQAYHRDTGGAFDCTVGPLSRLYGLYDEPGRDPGEADIQAALLRVGMNKVVVDAAEGTVRFTQPGVQLDFGGIGKGLALDAAVELLRAAGVRRALLHGGTSSVYAMGAPPGAKGWTVHIRHPYNAEQHVATVVLRDESLSTSGCYGDRACNIFDPRNGRPVRGMLSASAVAPLAMTTDALSTAFLVMGPAETRRYCAAQPETRALLVPEAVDGTLKVVWIGHWKNR